MLRNSSRVSLRLLTCAAALSIQSAVAAQPNPQAPATPGSAQQSTASAGQIPGNTPGTIFGTWQGTIPGNDGGRAVIRIRKNGDESLRGSLTFIDEDAQGRPIHLSFTASILSFAVWDIGYRARLGADTNSIEGTWTQGKESFPLTFTRATPGTLWTYSGPAPPLAMPADADPAFEVATIKSSQPGPRSNASSGMHGHEFQGANLSVAALIRIAYNIRDRQVVGGPSWMTDDRFDIAAEPDVPGSPSDDQLRTMVRKLLEDRFGLKVHMEQRDFAVFALVVDKPPAKITPSDPAPRSAPAVHSRIYAIEGPDGDTVAQFASYTMPDLAGTMMTWVQSRQVVDGTGLKGQFDFIITVPASVRQPGPDDAPEAGLGRAIAPLGLKLVPRHERLKVVVVDAIARPSAN